MIFKNRLTLGLFVAILLYLGLRFLFLFSNFDDMAVPSYEIFPMGTMAKNILDASGYPILGYCDTHSGGELITGLGAIPFFMILGHTYLALKMTPLFTGLMVLVILFFFLKIHFSSRAALLGAFLFALAPTTLVKHSLLAMGNHFEILLPISLLLFCFYWYHFKEQKKLWLALTAICAGFCIFHNFSSMLVIALLSLVHFGMRGYYKTMWDLLLVIPFMIIGIFPLILINLGTSRGGGDFLEAKFMGGDSRAFGVFFDRLGDFFGNHFSKVGSYRDFAGVSSVVAEWAFIGCFLLAFAIALPCLLRGLRVVFLRLMNRSASELDCLKIFPFMLYLPLLATAYSAGNFRLGGYPDAIKACGYRYFLTHLFFALLLISIQAARLSRKGKGLGWAFGGAALLLGVFNLGEADLGFSHPKSLGMKYDGYSYFQSARGMFIVDTDDLAKQVDESIQGLDPLFQHQVCWGLGNLCAMLEIRPTISKKGKNKGKADLKNISIKKILSNAPEKYRIDAALGVGEYLRKKWFQKAMDNRKIKEFVQNNPGIYTPYVIQGLMTKRTFIKTEQAKGVLRGNERFIRNFPKIFEFDLWGGHGFQCGHFLNRGIQQEEAWIKEAIARVPRKYQNVFFYGMGMGYVGANLPIKMIPQITDKPNTYLWAGFGAGLRKIYGTQTAQEKLQALSAPKEIMDAILTGMDWKNYPKSRERAFFKQEGG